MQESKTYSAGWTLFFVVILQMIFQTVIALPLLMASGTLLVDNILPAVVMEMAIFAVSLWLSLWIFKRRINYIPDVILQKYLAVTYLGLGVVSLIMGAEPYKMIISIIFYPLVAYLIAKLYTTNTAYLAGGGAV